MTKSSIHSSFDKIALELGRVDMAWSMIEDLVEAFVAALLYYEERSEIVRCITANADIRNKLQMVKSMSFLRKKDDLWFDMLVKHLDTIDNDLRPRRNVFIHAHWYKPGRKIIRQNRRTKLKRPQSFKHELTTHEETPVKASDVRKLHKDMMTTWSNMLLCLWFIPSASDPSDPPSPEVTFQKYLREAGRVLRLKRTPQMRKRPRQSRRV